MPARMRGAGEDRVLDLIRSGTARTRTELVESTGLSRSTVAQRVDELISRSLVLVGDEGVSTGGRRPRTLRFNPRAGHVLAIACGASITRVGVADLSGRVLAARSLPLDIAVGPDAALRTIRAAVATVLEASRIDPGTLAGAGVGLPGPVERATGMIVSPPIMPGWDGYPVGSHLEEALGVPVLIDNDANVMALGEHRTRYPRVASLLFIKISTGIGSGMVLDGRIHSGAHGAAGDIGHIHVPGHDDVVCSCGNAGCLEAVASGSALARELVDIDHGSDVVDQIVERVRRGDVETGRLVRQAGRELGEVLAMLVNVHDPEVVVIGGRLARAQRPLMIGAREVVQRRSPTLATHSLRIEPAATEDADLVGAALMAVDRVLDSAMSSGSGAPHPVPPRAIALG